MHNCFSFQGLVNYAFPVHSVYLFLSSFNYGLNGPRWIMFLPRFPSLNIRMSKERCNLEKYNVSWIYFYSQQAIVLISTSSSRIWILVNPRAWREIPFTGWLLFEHLYPSLSAAKGKGQRLRVNLVFFFRLRSWKCSSMAHHLPVIPLLHGDMSALQY